MGIATFPFRLPNELMEEFGVFSGVHWCGWEIESHICDAIRAYMKPQPAAQPQQAAVADGDTGYQWKQIFLPEGTRLRASFGRTPYFAVVQGNAIRCGEQSLSPSAFANLQGSGNRNAWKAVWLRFPGDQQWVLADTCRAQQKAAIAGHFGVAAPRPATAPRAAPPHMPAASPQPAGRAVSSDQTVKHRVSGKRRKHQKRRKQRAAPPLSTPC